MASLNRGELPVLAFALCVLAGLAMQALTNEWFWAALALVVGIVAGDLVDALVRRTAAHK